MFNQIKETNKPLPYQTFSIVLSAAAVTLGTLIFPNFINVFGSNKTDISSIQNLSLIFQHGYDLKSGMVHFLGCAVLLLFMGGTLEKLMGPNRFFVFNMVIILAYGISHKLIGMIGHGLTPLLFAYVPFIAYSLNEGRLIKTRSMYDEYYKTLWAMILIVIILIPILLSIIPIYFDSNAHFSEQVILGNVLHVILLIVGAIFAFRWKETVRHRLLYFAKKKKFPPHRFERFTPYLAIVYPLILLFVFITNK
jgi:membrane associated rhomboid family serine protease